MKTFYIKTLGCKTNQIESNLMSEKLEEAGYVLSNSVETADIFVLNSCSVTSSADDEAVRILKKLRRENPETFVILTGCMAQLEAEKLKDADYVDLVLGNSEKMDIAKYINNKNKINVSNIFEQENFIYQKVQNPFKSRAFLKIQDGCNNRCSYCTIWKARGKSRSSSLEQIEEQIKIYVEHGFEEVVITGIHIGQWGEDLNPEKNFLDFVKALETTEIKRYRLGSLNPFEITEELIDFLSKSDKFCPHFHLSLQSVCDKTLKTMNRHYTSEQILKQINLINEKFNLPFIGSDIIVGFPGETDADFETTYNNIKSSGLTMAHIFPYSIRKNTAAAAMSGQVPAQVKHDRLNKLKTLVNEKFEDFKNKNTGTIRGVIFQKNKCKKTGMYKGVTDNYLTVYSASVPPQFGKVLNCKIAKNLDGRLTCEIL